MRRFGFIEVLGAIAIAKGEKFERRRIEALVASCRTIWNWGLSTRMRRSPVELPTAASDRTGHRLGAKPCGKKEP